MNDNYEQNSNISKQQTLRDLDVQDENILALQENINNLIKVEKEISEIICIDDDDEGNEEDIPMSHPVQFSVNIKVEKCLSGSEEEDNGDSVVEDNPDSLSTRENTSNTPDVIYSGADDSDDDSENYVVRRVLSHKTKDEQVLVKEYVLTRKSILKAIRLQSRHDTTHVDRYLNIATRNLIGEFKVPKLSFHDQLIHDALEKWKDWYAICPGFRSSPLLYKCYICNKGWWRLYTFREHIKLHTEPNLKITNELREHEFFLAAYTNESLLLRRILNVHSNCWKCGRPASFHSLSKTSLHEYRCEACKTLFTSCIKLTIHESMCMQYLENIRKKLNLETFALLICFLCQQSFLKEADLDLHLSDCHTVRSDEPAAVKGKRCFLCFAYIYDAKCHDCPKKNKILHCKYCFRKFSSKTFYEIHSQSYYGLYNCDPCKKSMKSCVALEHMLDHSKHYKFYYKCVRCADNVLFDTVSYFKRHMKIHESWVNRKRWRSVVLLPVKCTNRNFVKSEIRLSIPQHKFDYFMYGILNTSDLSIDTTRLLDTQEDEQDIISSDTNCHPEPRNEMQIELDETGQSEIQNNEFDDNALQEQLDAEILRDVEMEAAISKVFKASNVYQKFLEKETEEPEVDEYEDDLIIIEKPDQVTIISDSDSEPDDITMAIKQSAEHKSIIVSKRSEEIDLNNESAIKKEADINNIPEVKVECDKDVMNDTTLKEDNKKEEEHLYNQNVIKREISCDKITVEESSDTKVLSDITLKLNDATESKNGDEHLNNSTAIKKELDCDKTIDINKQANNNVVSSIKLIDEMEYKSVYEHLCRKIVVKEDPEWNDLIEIHEGSDLLVVNKIKEETVMSCEEDEEKPLSQLATEKGKGRLQCSSYNKEDSVSADSNSGPDYKTIQFEIDETADKKDQLFECSECMYQGSHVQYMEHVTIKCDSVTFSCSQCTNTFHDLKHYARHLSQHNLKEFTCPDCGQHFKFHCMLCAHIKQHLRRLFVYFPIIENLPVSSTINYVFKCRKCLMNINVGQFFNHWESHLEANDKKQEDVGSNSCDLDARKERLNPYILRDVLEILVLRDKYMTKKCIVCRRKFSRRQDCKRHLIEHLLVDALLNTDDSTRHLRCQLCNMGNMDVSGYKQHMRDHAAMPLYKCSLCSKCFSDSSNFSKHKKVHNDFSYICDVCGGKFHSKAYLQSHLKRHKTNPPRCKDCDMTFLKASELKKHIKNQHFPKQTSYPCKLCTRRFESLKDKWDHMWLKHNLRKVNADCPICNKSYRRVIDVRRHMREDHLVHKTELYGQTFQRAT